MYAQEPGQPAPQDSDLETRFWSLPPQSTRIDSWCTTRLGCCTHAIRADCRTTPWKPGCRGEKYNTLRQRCRGCLGFLLYSRQSQNLSLSRPLTWERPNTLWRSLSGQWAAVRVLLAAFNVLVQMTMHYPVEYMRDTAQVEVEMNTRERTVRVFLLLEILGEWQERNTVHAPGIFNMFRNSCLYADLPLNKKWASLKHRAAMLDRLQWTVLR